jgi:hypothetical protein
MSLSSAAASLQRSRAPAGPRVLIACGGAARLPTLPALRALAGDRREIKIPAADLTSAIVRFPRPTPFHPNTE